MRSGICRQRHEHHVAAARLGDPSARDDSAVVAVEHYLQQHPGIVGRSPCLVIAIAMLEDSQIEMLLNDLVEGILERTFDDLVGVRQRNHLRLIQVVMFVSGHRAAPVTCLDALCIHPDPKFQELNGLFLRPQRIWFHLQAHYGKTHQIKVKHFRRLTGANQSWTAGLTCFLPKNLPVLHRVNRIPEGAKAWDGRSQVSQIASDHLGCARANQARGQLN